MFPSWLHPRQWIDPLSSKFCPSDPCASSYNTMGGISLPIFFLLFAKIVPQMDWPNLSWWWIYNNWQDINWANQFNKIQLFFFLDGTIIILPHPVFLIVLHWLARSELSTSHMKWDTHEIYVTIVKRVFFLYDAWKNKCVCRGGYFRELLYSCAVELSLNKVYVISIIH